MRHLLAVEQLSTVSARRSAPGADVGEAGDQPDLAPAVRRVPPHHGPLAPPPGANPAFWCRLFEATHTGESNAWHLIVSPVLSRFSRPGLERETRPRGANLPRRCHLPTDDVLAVLHALPLALTSPTRDCGSPHAGDCTRAWGCAHPRCCALPPDSDLGHPSGLCCVTGHRTPPDGFSGARQRYQVSTETCYPATQSQLAADGRPKLSPRSAAGTA